MKKLKKSFTPVDMKKAKEFSAWVEATVERILKGGLLIDYVDLDKVYITDNSKHYDSIFTMSYHKQYHTGTLSIYPAAYRLYDEGNLEELENGLIHEMCHIHTIPVAELARERHVGEKELLSAFEELTQTMAQYVK